MIVAFIFGLFIGANVGLIVAAMLAMRGRSERQLEAWARAYEHESDVIR
jgi:hypothetical protein